MKTESLPSVSLPELRIGAYVRPRVEPYTERRGVVVEQSGRVWGVRLNGDHHLTDFSERELTVLE